MTKTQTTTQAAHTAQVSPRTIRRWAANGSVSATKTTKGWAIDADSLTEVIASRTAKNADRILTLADFTPYKDQDAARAKVRQLLEDGALVPTSRPGQYSAAGSKGDRYLVDTYTAECDCPSGIRNGYCSHRTAADAIEGSKGNAAPLLALVAA